MAAGASTGQRRRIRRAQLINGLGAAATGLVFIPEYVVGHWWEQLLHNQSALRLKTRLVFVPNVVIIDIPWHLPSAGVHRERQAHQLHADYEHQAAAAYQLPPPHASQPPPTPPRS